MGPFESILIEHTEIATKVKHLWLSTFNLAARGLTSCHSIAFPSSGVFVLVSLDGRPKGQKAIT